MKAEYISVNIRLPDISGEYEIINNTGCNEGYGVVYYDVNNGFEINSAIKSFYKVLAWNPNNISLS
jgi:hypothetical protein